VHRLTWHKAGQNQELFRDYFLQALIDSGAMVTLQDHRQSYIFLANLPPCWSVPTDSPLTDRTLYGEAIGGQLMALKDSLSAEADQGSLEISTAEGRTYRFKIHAAPIGDPSAPGGAQGARHFLTTITDLTDERQQQAVLNDLLRELSHRSKNLLAIVQGLATLSARNSDRLDLFLAKYRGRLAALSTAQDLITESGWRGAWFRDLALGQLAAFSHHHMGALAISGENLLLPPNAALHVGLALHELIANAAAHGRAMQSDQTAALSLSLTAQGQACLEWTEALAGAADAPPPPRYLGATILETVVPTALNGRADYQLSGQGVSYRLVFPL
jgi:two-component sensor histidine kinase